MARGLWFWIIVPLSSAAAGLLYSALFTGEGMIGAALRGALIGTPILMYERGFILSRWRTGIRQRATPLFAAATIATYTVMIVVNNAVAGGTLHVAGIMADPRDAMMLSRPGLLYALGVSALFVFVFRVRDLIGPGVFMNLLLGRYHRPTSEERIFLFLDVVGSTRFAERHGDLAAQEYLGQIFNALALPVR
jgi:adenylate cyclase